MNEYSINLFIASEGHKFPKYQLREMKYLMNQMRSEEVSIAQSLDYKNPSMIVFMSYFFGFLGVDRLLIGDTFLGILKLLTCGGCGVWFIVDWFIIVDRTRNVNYSLFRKFAEIISHS